MSIAEKLTQVAENEPRIYDKGYAEGFESGRNVIARLIDRTITEIEIPDGVTSIGAYAFSYCEGLASVTIPESVTSIGKYAFGWCYKLSDVTIPDGVTSIGGHAFYYCEGITGIVIPDGVTSIATSVFSRCKRLQRITIPDTVVSISDYAFYYCEGITNVSIGSGVTKIGNSAFEGCSNVVVYDFSKCTSVPTLASASSITVNNATQIIVPDELYEAWTSATNWVRYKDYIQTESKGIVKAAPNEDNFSVYVDANTLKEIVDYNVFGKDLVQGIGESEVLYEGDVPYLRIYGDGASAEAYAFMPNTEGDTTGRYLTFAYRIPTGNSKTVDYFEVYANSTGALPTGQGDFFSIKTNHDGKWTVVAIDVKEAIATYKDVVNGTYQSQFTGNNIQHLRIDFFNQVTPTTDYIDIAYIGTCTSLALARSADPDYESATFDAVRLAQTHTKAVRNTYNGMDYVTITDTTTSGGEANTALVLSDAVLPNTANYIGVLYRNAPGGFVEFFASSDNSKWATSARSNYDTSDGWHFAIVSLNSSIFKDSVCRRLRFDYLNNLKANTKYSIDIAFAKFFSSVDEANAYYQEYATKYNV